MKSFVKVMKALSDPNRVKIIKLLQLKYMCVCELQGALKLAQPTVSKHLKILEEAGLVDSLELMKYYGIMGKRVHASQADVQKLQQKGILVRYFDQALLRNGIRFSVGKPEHNDALIKTLQELGEE